MLVVRLERKSSCRADRIQTAVAGCVPPTSDEIRLRDETVTGIDPRCGMVFQSQGLFP